MTLNALICDLNYDAPHPEASAKGFEGENLIKSVKLKVSIVKSLFISLNENKYRRLISKQNNEQKIYKWLKKIVNESKAVAKAILDTFRWGQENEPMGRRRKLVTALWRMISRFDVLNFRSLNSQLTNILTNLSKNKDELSKSGSKHSIIEGNLVNYNVKLNESKSSFVNYDVQPNESKSISVNQYSDSGLNSVTHGDHGDPGENNDCSTSENVNLNVISNVNENKDIYNLKKVTYYTSNLMFISTSIMLALTIGLLLLAQTIEPNPGPNHNEDKTDDTKINALKKRISQIITYNCNGLGNPNKLRRLLMKLDNIVKKKGIVFLQETHIVNTDQLKKMWKYNFLSNCVKTNSAGVIILFNNELKIIEKNEDEEGRLLIAVLQSEDSNWIVANAYYPNDHRIGIAFAEKMYLKVLEMQAKYPNHTTICAGDYNLCLTDKDLLNRKRGKSEQLLAENITENNKVAKLVDTYRSQNQKEGFTWNRGNCYSRLDHIFISADSIKRVKKATTDWCLEKSDHAAVTVDFLNVEKLQKGPGIVKVNTKILDDQKVVLQVAREIENMMSQVDESWNPHSKLEFLKVAIRTVISSKTSEVRNGIREEIKDTEEEINQLENLKIKILATQGWNSTKQNDSVERIEKANDGLGSKLDSLRKKFSETLAFVSKAKWYEYGEKSNKFFLNLNKSFQNQKLIHGIRNGVEEYIGQNEVSKGITDFYRKLYRKEETNNQHDENFYRNCPKITTKQEKDLEQEMTLKELYNALATCKDSSPGPDGIPYSIYKKFWKQTGQIILDAWNHSLKIGNLPPSHLESAITILPKEGKDTSDIKNWRPITLSNCDSKIITKALSIRTAKVLNTIIDESQTAYVPGRSVADNLRTNFYYKNYCRRNKSEAVLISLDAKKAFDSVDHKYIEKTLVAYGFGEGFVKIFKTLYNDITARVQINGYASEKIRIERGVKQGDALSCALFIICIDPLLRNLNANTMIKEIPMMKKNGKRNDLIFKCSAYADDISIICGNQKESISQVFLEYEKLTDRSGLELNADKTEILNLKNKEKVTFNIAYKNCNFEITTVDKIKICGLYFCTEMEEEHKLNVTEKIIKLTRNIKKWSPRNLTMEGKTLIVKTFGLSQIIYNMQSYGFEDEDLTTIERTIFKFLWSTQDNPNGIDRIKRSIMKNDHSEGGMKVTDVESLNRSLKLKQFIRSSNTKHVISKIQLIETSTKDNPLLQEYYNISEDEPICQSAQKTINMISDYNRQSYNKYPEERYETDKILIEEVASINIITFLKRGNKIFHLCMMKELSRKGIETLGELTQTMEYESDENQMKIMKMILGNFPKVLQNISKCYNEDINSNSQNLKHMMINTTTRKKIEDVTTKELQVILKIVLKKIESQDFTKKLKIDEFEKTNVMNFRRTCRNSKLRNIYFRLINNDFFTRERMFKYKMIDNDRCTRCGQVETVKHLLYECEHSKRIWNLYNEILILNKQETEQVLKYNSIFQIGRMAATNIIKIRLIQCLIQIERPRDWSQDNIKTVIKEIMNMEKYNSIKNKMIVSFEKKWSTFKHIM